MTRCVRNGEMPICSSRLEKYDIDRSGGLSVAELNKIAEESPRDVGLIFRYGMSPAENCYVTPEAALQIFQKLNESARIQVLSDISIFSINDDATKKFMSYLVSKKPVLLCRDLTRAWKRAGSDKFKQDNIINKIVLFIRGISPNEQRIFLNTLKRTSPPLFEAVHKRLENTYVPRELASAAEALHQIRQDMQARGKVGERRKPIVFGVGEEHPQSNAITDNIATPAQRFADEILPELVRKHGVTKVAIEFIPSDAGQFGRIDIHNLAVRLAMSTNPRTASNITALLRAVNKLQEEGYEVEVVGIGPSTQQIKLLYDGAIGNKELIDAINENAARLANSLNNRSGNIVIYAGSIHNDFIGIIHDNIEFSYVPLLKEHLTFVSIDLIVPYYLRFPINVAERNAQLHPPKDGVRLFKRGLNLEYVIVLPSPIPPNIIR